MPVQLKPISFIANNSSEEFVTGSPVSCGIPLPEGTCWHTEGLAVTTSGLNVECELTTLSRWPDESLRWVLVECFVDIEAFTSIDCVLQVNSDNNPPGASITEQSAVRDDEKISSIPSHQHADRTRSKRFVELRDLALFKQMDFELTGLDGYPVEYIRDGEAVVDHGAVRSTLRSNGSFVDAKGTPLLGLCIRIDAFPVVSRYKIQVTIHNKNAARHVGGYWDLGDEGSIFFKDFEVVFRGFKDFTLQWCSEGEVWSSGGSSAFSIHQLSSGSETVNSPNHVNDQNRLPELDSGFTVKANQEIVQRGSRISPYVKMVSEKSSWIFSLDNFWQNFPKTIHRDGDAIKIGLFPREYPDHYELQGGEKKTHTLQIFQSVEDAGCMAVAEPVVVLSKARMVAKILPFDEDVPADEAMDSLIQQGIDGPNSFFIKRERIDEYGWRNFGDVYADHETWLNDTGELFSSHYNNQYDLIYGFLRMYMLSAKPEWYRLASELAEHVLDIDLYHTKEDRVEYNGGLFWHTAHYLPAQTSTHRSYSKLQEHDPSQAGGGPGGEHCYTTGLKLYYLTTGCERAKHAVVELAAWVGYFYDGSGTMIEAFIKLLRWRLKACFQVFRGANISRHRYPIHRGIGNLIVAQLDSFEITCERKYLDRAEHVILGAIGPLDDLVARGLEDVEGNWFYSIFLQSLIRYLDVKRSLKEYDSSFFYARDSLMHYSDWIVLKEQPYLDNPDVLEYANHTWAAQDIRRCAILLDAYRYADSERPDYLARSQFFARYVVRELGSEPTSSYTRILAILMQNHGASALAIAGPMRHPLPPAVPYTAKLHEPHTLVSVLSEEVTTLKHALLNFSFRTEWNWLRVRF